MTNAVRWWWVRHAPVPNAGRRLYGQDDLSCDTSDEGAFNALAAQLPDGAAWIVSPLKRTSETRDALLATGRFVQEETLPPTIEPAFLEQDFGRWQGLNWPEMEASDPDAYFEFWRDPTRVAPPKGESFVDLMDRVHPAITRLTEQFAGRDIICLSHGGTIRAAIALALELSPKSAMALVIDNLALSRLDYMEDGLLRGKGGSWMVRGINV